MSLTSAKPVLLATKDFESGCPPSPPVSRASVFLCHTHISFFFLFSLSGALSLCLSRVSPCHILSCFRLLFFFSLFVLLAAGGLLLPGRGSGAAPLAALAASDELPAEAYTTIGVREYLPRGEFIRELNTPRKLKKKNLELYAFLGSGCKAVWIPRPGRVNRRIEYSEKTQLFF